MDRRSFVRALALAPLAALLGGGSATAGTTQAQDRGRAAVLYYRRVADGMLRAPLALRQWVATNTFEEVAGPEGVAAARAAGVWPGSEDELALFWTWLDHQYVTAHRRDDCIRASRQCVVDEGSGADRRARFWRRSAKTMRLHPSLRVGQAIGWVIHDQQLYPGLEDDADALGVCPFFDDSLVGAFASWFEQNWPRAGTAS